jgi:hypothetical protein
MSERDHSGREIETETQNTPADGRPETYVEYWGDNDETIQICEVGNRGGWISMDARKAADMTPGDIAQGETPEEWIEYDSNAVVNVEDHC